jgi:hypothetical protein
MQGCAFSRWRCKMAVYLQLSTNLVKGNIMPEWDKFIEETAYHVLSFGEFNTKDQYNKLGRIMAVKYPK